MILKVCIWVTASSYVVYQLRLTINGGTSCGRFALSVIPTGCLCKIKIPFILIIIKSIRTNYCDTTWYVDSCDRIAKHKCERDLKSYVANNWMKLAMILSGLEVCTSDCVDFETGKVYNRPVSFQDILTNNINFICRRKMYTNFNQMHYRSIYPYAPDNLKYISK